MMSIIQLMPITMNRRRITTPLKLIESRYLLLKCIIEFLYTLSLSAYFSLKNICFCVNLATSLRMRQIRNDKMVKVPTLKRIISKFGPQKYRAVDHLLAKRVDHFNCVCFFFIRVHVPLTIQPTDIIPNSWFVNLWDQIRPLRPHCQAHQQSGCTPNVQRIKQETQLMSLS